MEAGVETGRKDPGRRKLNGCAGQGSGRLEWGGGCRFNGGVLTLRGMANIGC